MDLLNVQEGASRPSLLSSIWSLQVQMQNESDPLTLEMPALFSAGGSQQSLPGALSSGVGASGHSMAAATSSEMMLDDTADGGRTGQLNTTVHHYNGGIGVIQPFRSVKSLSDLKNLTLPRPNPTIGIADHYLSIDSPITEATSTMPADYRQQPSTSAAASASTRQYGTPARPAADNPPAAATAGNGDGAISRQQRNNNVCAWLQSLSLAEEEAPAAAGPTAAATGCSSAFGQNFLFQGGTTAASMEMETQPQ